jgi:S1-C subfamily serine protease
MASLIRRLGLSIAIIAALGVVSVDRSFADVTNSADLDASSPPPGVGTVDEYVGRSSSFNRPTQRPANVPQLGLSVLTGVGRLESGAQLSGLNVISVDQRGAGYDAGIRGRQIRVGKAAEEVGATVLVVGAAAFFPPAIFGVPLLMQMQSPRSYDVLVAVDGERVQDVDELANSLREAKAGETIYVTIIRNGHRVQLRISMPNAVSASSLSSPR